MLAKLRSREPQRVMHGKYALAGGILVGYDQHAEYYRKLASGIEHMANNPAGLTILEVDSA